MTAQECFEILGFLPLRSLEEYSPGQVLDIETEDGGTVQGITGRVVVLKKMTLEDEESALAVLRAHGVRTLPPTLRHDVFKLYAVVAE